MASQDFDQQRLKDVEDNLAKERELLKQFEDKLRYETNPRIIGNYQENIERQKQAIAGLKKEYDELQLRSENRPTVSNSSPNEKSSEISDREQIDVGIIIALEEEFEVLYEQLPSPISIKDEQTGNYDYLFQWSVPNTFSYSCAATFFGDMGPSKAALACERFLNRRQPKTIVMLGIAGGLNTDVKLGDIVLATSVNLYLERAKAVDGQEETFEIKPGGDFYRCSDDLVQASSNLKFAHSNLYRRWQADSHYLLEKLIPKERLAQLLNANWVREKPFIVKGSVASGPVVGASEKFTNWLKKTNRNYLALEMEVGGLLSAVYSQADPKKTLILRGISDFGDRRKQELDQIGKGGIRRYAMNNATRLLWKLLEAQVLRRAIDSSLEEKIK